MSHADTTSAERRIDNIEFNVADIARSKAFYGAVFGWSFTDYGPGYTEFDDGRLRNSSFLAGRGFGLRAVLGEVTG
jgi:predicted enzyme related to lactoylglutathione lyase